MKVRKVRGEDRISKVVVSQADVLHAKALGVEIKTYIKRYLEMIAKKRRWAWYLAKGQK
jgi:hypothetical protein